MVFIGEHQEVFAMNIGWRVYFSEHFWSLAECLRRLIIFCQKNITLKLVLGRLLAHISWESCKLSVALSTRRQNVDLFIFYINFHFLVRVNVVQNLNRKLVIFNT